QQCAVADGALHAAGTFTNQSARTRSYRLRIDLLRPGTTSRVGGLTVDVDDVAPGATSTWTAQQVTLHAELSCGDVDVTGPMPFGG
ncbi:MAG TPA: hypothetical protein PLV68_11095, partial [Ilumatobacteraceae bacterium]|nr:hypothetical protein [Ilumatobacteraceae bacterium]